MSRQLAVATPDRAPSSQARRKQGGRKQQPTLSTGGSHFKGKTPELKGFVFGCTGSNSAKLYVEVRDEIAEYCGRNFKHGGDILQTIKNKERIAIPEPAEVSEEDAKKLDKRRLFERTIDAAANREQRLEDNMKRAFTVAVGQCTELTTAKLHGTSNWTKINKDLDLIELLKLVKELMQKFEEHKYEVLALHSALKRLYLFKQGSEMTNEKFLERFKTLADVVDERGGDIGVTTASLKNRVVANGASSTNPWTADESEVEVAKQEAREEYLAVALLSAADPGRYSQLNRELANDYIKAGCKGRDSIYPRTVVGAYGLLKNYKSSTERRNPKPGKGLGGLSFVNKGEEGEEAALVAAGGKGWKGKGKLPCHNCWELGHFARDCTNEARPMPKEFLQQYQQQANAQTNAQQHVGDKGEDEVAQVNVGGDDDSGDDYQQWDDFSLLIDGVHHHESISATTGKQVGKVRFGEVFLAQARRIKNRIIDPNWLLLDSESTITLIRNPKLVTNIQLALFGRYVTMHSDGGARKVRTIATFGTMGDIWFDSDAIANILGLADVWKIFG